MAERGVDGLGTMLGVWAHPDDETYLTAGLMARAVQHAQRVSCVTATRGEAGSWDETKWPGETLGQVRDAELMASLAILGVSEHHWLGYADGGCADVAFEEGVEAVLSILEAVDPDSVFTFGPEGMTDHPDHKAVSGWTTEAFDRSAKTGARLFYATATPDWVAQWKPMLDRFNVFYSPDTPPVTPREELAIEYDLPPDILELKTKAIAAHASQTEGFSKAFGPDFLRDSNAGEFFVLAETKA